ncbi:cation-efflux pump, partial [Escherichia coli]|nr:cation-efflux pump [Escherichia coli]
LMDRAVDQETASEIREVILGTPGVLGVHDVRTRKMGDMILVDAHLEIESTATVKVGHDIALEARRRVMQRRDVLKVMTHVDPVNGLPAGTS